MSAQNYSIAGVGTLAAGEYDKISISGSGTIMGDVVCTGMHTAGSSGAKGKIDCKGAMHTSGSFHGEEDVTAEEVHTSGSSHFGANLTVSGLLRTSGSTHVCGNLEVKDASTSGSLHVEGTLTAEKIETSGKLEVGKDCSAEEFISSGRLEIGGLLNAETVRIELNSASDSHVDEIGGEKITITWKPISGFLSRLFGGGRCGMLETNAIEGDEVHLEQVRAKVVRGRNVTIGSGSYVKLVEYTGTLQAADGATIEKQVQVE